MEWEYLFHNPSYWLLSAMHTLCICVCVCITKILFFQSYTVFVDAILEAIEFMCATSSYEDENN